MRVNHRSLNGRIEIVAEGDTQKEVFQQLASLQEVFEETSCGMPNCKSENLRFVVRTVDDNNFYELHCLDCRARFVFGQHKKNGTLFPKRKDDEGKWLANRGWARWEPEKKEEN